MTGPQGTSTAAGSSQYVFFLSYARKDGDAHLRRFFEDLREMVGRLMGPAAGEAVGFMDTSDIEPGQCWPARLEEALSTCRAFVPILSPTYFTREACGREWAFFRYRLELVEGQIPPLIIPILWVPLRESYEEQSFDVSDIQVIQRDLGDVYAREGLYYLLDVADRKDYREFLRRFAGKLIEAVEKHPLPAIGAPPPLKELESAFRGRSLPGRREEDLLSKVETVCRLREPRAQIEKIHGAGRSENHLRVSVLEDEIVRMYPVGAVDRGITQKVFHGFLEEVDARYRISDPGIISILVYGGDPAPEDLLREARAKRVRLMSFVEYQGLIDFRGYVSKQTAKLAADPVYPPRLYVDQRMIQLGREGEFDNVLAQLRDWLNSPSGRFILVLGDFGTGKTFLLHELARRMGEEGTGLIPILLQMRSLEKGRSLDELLAQHFVREEMEDFQVRKFRYMLEQGRIALLFDGFDELALRVTYPRATEHFDTLLQAATGVAKVVVTSRRQHFLSEQQVVNVLGGRVESQVGNRIVLLRPFNRNQIRQFLIRLCGGEKKADARLGLIERIKDLLGLSENPRMLGFIAELPEEQLLEAEAGEGEITAATLYRLILEKWLQGESERVSLRGAPLSLSVEDRWKALTALALRLWQQTERSVGVEELTEDVVRALETLTTESLDPATAAFQVGSGTLLVRDVEGRFSFIHHSVLEWLVAQAVAEQLEGGKPSEYLALREMSPLMAEFILGLTGREKLTDWVIETLSSDSGVSKSSNALLLARRLREKGIMVDQRLSKIYLAGRSLRGKDLSGQDLRGADLSSTDLVSANLSKASLQNARLVKAKLRDADLAEVNLSGADLSEADLTGARLIGADLTKTILDRAVFHRAKLVGALMDEGAFSERDQLGLAWSVPESLEAYVSSSFYIGSFYEFYRQRPVAWSMDGDLLASADGFVMRLWEVGTGRELRRLAGHEAGVLSVSFSPDGSRLASGSADGTVRLWEVGTGRELQRLENHDYGVLSVSFSPLGDRLASGSADRTVRLWEVGTGRQLHCLEGHESSVLNVSFSPDGTHLASGSTDGTVRLWEVGTGRELRRLEGHKTGVLSVSFSPDGTRLASGSADRTVRLWEVGTGRELRRLEGHEDRIWSVSFSPDGTRLASGSADRTMRLWEVGTGRELRRLEGHEDRIWSVSFSPDGSRLASGSADGTVRLWEVGTGRELRRLEGHENSVLSVSFSPDGARLTSGSTDGTVRLWEFGRGRELYRLEGHLNSVLNVSFSPNGSCLASGSADGTVRLWEIGIGRELCLEGHEDRVLSVSFSPDGARLASGSADRTVRLWEVGTGRKLHRLEKLQSLVLSVGFSPDGTRLASGSADWTVQLWDVGTGRELHRLEGHKHDVLSVNFSPDGTRLASGSADRRVRLWEVETGRELHRLEGHEDRVLNVSFSPDGARLASGSADRTVRLWNVRTNQELGCLEGHEAAVRAVAFSPDGNYLASGSEDNTIRLWEVATGRCLAILGHLPEGWVAFAPDGRYKIGGVPAGGFWHVIGLCRFEPGELDPYVPGLRLPDDASFLNLPPWDRTGIAPRV